MDNAIVGRYTSMIEVYLSDMPLIFCKIYFKKEREIKWKESIVRRWKLQKKE